MNNASITSLVALVRQRMNLVNMANIDDTTLQTFCTSALSQLYELVVSRWKDYYIAPPSYLSLLPNTQSYPLPLDFRAMSQVYLVFGAYPNSASLNQTTANQRKQPLRRFNWNQYQAYASIGSGVNPGQWPQMYRIVGRNILFTPVTNITYTNAIELWYTPQYEPPINVNDTIDPVLPNGWERWVEMDMCCQVAARMRIPEFYQMYGDLKKQAQELVMAAANVRDEESEVMEDINDDRGNGWFGTPGTGGA